MMKIYSGFDTIPSNSTISKNYVFSIDTNLWHAPFGTHL